MVFSESEWNGDKLVVVPMVVPVSDGNFAFGENVFDKLEKFGFAIVFSLEETLYGGANVPGMINVSWCIAECFVMGLEFDVHRK